MTIMNPEVISETQQAGALETGGRLEEAAKIYEQVIRTRPLDEHPYNRLMIIYRKLRKPKDELRVLKSAIAVFEAKYIKKSRSKKLTDLSNALMKTSGLSDKKGKLLVYPEPIAKWQKRKELLEKRLKQ
jgi:hypothetical protein